jgi:DNA mismatch endonuclease Vsr
MQAIKCKGSKIEQALGKRLWSIGLRYRKNNKTVFGKPDFTFKKYKIAIFVDSEFWHGKDWHNRRNDIKSNQDFWYNKIERNIERDLKVNDFLNSNGWKVIRFWGKEIENNIEICVKEIETILHEIKRESIN